MAILTTEEVLKRISEPKNKKSIDLAVFQEERLFLHSEPILEKYNLPFNAFRNFTTWWQGLVSSVKYQKIDELLNCPMFTVGIVKDVFDQLQKFIDAQDRYVEFKFSDRDYTNDYYNFLERSNDETFWKSKILHELKTGICSYVVVDLPSTQITERPEPYNYFVSPRSVIDVDINKFNGSIEYIIFRQSDFLWDEKSSSANSNALLNLLKDNTKTEKLICIDDKSYKIFVKQENKGSWNLLSESLHDLGYCPVIDFWEDSIKGTNGINKIGPITLQLGNLDYILFFKACIDYMNLYGPFPMAFTYDFDEQQFDDKTKETNFGQNYDYSKTNPVSNAGQTQPPQTSGKRFNAPGGGMRVPTPASPEDHDFMRNPMKFIGMDVQTVKQANELLDLFESNIKEKCTGVDTEYLNEIAKNKEMLAASFRKEETIMDWIKGNMERVHRFVTKTKCILRYGKEYFISCTIDYGSDRLLKDATTLTTEFKESIDAGMPQSYSYEIATTAAITRFKNNPEKLARLRILLDLEPYPNMSWLTMQSLGLNTSDKNNFIIKANFISFVSRFELENGSIVEFGESISYSEKISIIKKQFESYGSSIEWSEQNVGNSNGKLAGS